jgi:hypothetical protein
VCARARVRACMCLCACVPPSTIEYPDPPSAQYNRSANTVHPGHSGWYRGGTLGYSPGTQGVLGLLLRQYPTHRSALHPIPAKRRSSATRRSIAASWKMQRLHRHESETSHHDIPCGMASIQPPFVSLRCVCFETAQHVAAQHGTLCIRPGTGIFHAAGGPGSTEAPPWTRNAAGAQAWADDGAVAASLPPRAAVAAPTVAVASGQVGLEPGSLLRRSLDHESHNLKAA